MMTQNHNFFNTEIEDDCEEDIEFGSSELGTREYWNKSYKKDLLNFEKYGDIGDIWFGEESMLRVINWIKSSAISHSSNIIDIGCGNGILLSYLADEGFCNLFGVDYSEDAIKLAKLIAHKRETLIHFEVANIASKNFKNETTQKNLFDVVHDKGTFDAISLCPDDSKSMMQTYVENIAEILADGGFYILTSCNWTEKELILKFSYYFEKERTLPTPVFQFGGKVGSTITSLVMKKKVT